MPQALTPIRIAMWSGPRNISTAMMRSFGNREDCYVTDEPLYAHYLEQTGLDHPGRQETLAGQERDWQRVTRWLTGEIPDQRSIWYQKHMAHHLLPNIDRHWLSDLQHAFLIREPREMLTSLMKFIPQPRLIDTGLPQQLEIFQRYREEHQQVPPVIDGRDVLENPAGMLQELCRQLQIPWTSRMLSWPAGPRETDGAWASYWYASVNQTTGFDPYRPKADTVPDELGDVLAQCEEIYAQLARHKISAPEIPERNSLA